MLGWLKLLWGQAVKRRNSGSLYEDAFRQPGIATPVIKKLNYFKLFLFLPVIKKV